MIYEQINRAVGTVSGLSNGSDGSRLLNLYASESVQPRQATVPVMVRGAPGYKVAATSLSGNCKVLMSVDDPHYGNHLFILTESHVEVYEANFVTGALSLLIRFAYPNSYDVGTIPDNSPLRWATDGRYVLFITDEEIFGFDREKIQEHLGGKTTNPVWLSIVAPTPDDTSDSTDTEAWVDIVWADKYFILAAKGGQMFNSELGGITFNQLDFTRADYKPDGIVGLAVFSQRLFVFGTRSIERWSNRGLSEFPFIRDVSSSYDVGCYSRESITTNEVTIHFLGSDGVYYSLSGGRLLKVSNDAVHRVFRKTVLSSPDHTFLAFQYTDEGHKFVTIHADIADTGNAWVYDWSTQMWHERSATKAQFISGVSLYRNRNYVIQAGSPNIYIKSLESKLDFAGNEIVREMILPIVQHNQTRIRQSSFQIDIHYAGPVEDALKVDFAWSDDHKLTWQTREQVAWSPGRRTKWNNLGLVDSQGRNYRLRVTGANGELAVLGAYVEGELMAD